MCDYLTKWPEAYAIPKHKAETIAKIFVEEIVFRYGVPRKLLTDRGTEFLSTLIKGVNDYFEILKLNTSPYHPQTDGLVERFNLPLCCQVTSTTNIQIGMNTSPPVYLPTGTQYMQVQGTHHSTSCI